MSYEEVHHLCLPRHEAVGPCISVINRSRHLFTASYMPEPCITHHITRMMRHIFICSTSPGDGNPDTAFQQTHPEGQAGHWNPRNWVWNWVQLAIVIFLTAFHLVGRAASDITQWTANSTSTQWIKTRSCQQTCSWLEEIEKWRGTFQSTRQTPPTSSLFYSHQNHYCVLFIKTIRSTCKTDLKGINISLRPGQKRGSVLYGSSLSFCYTEGYRWLSMCRAVHHCMYMGIYLSMQESIHLSDLPSFHPSFYVLSIHLSAYTLSLPQ